VITARHGRPVSIMAFTVVRSRIVAIDGIRDTDRVRRLTAGVIPTGQ
jgi:RNA polymerase sigma-70 factor (ECF subfamily)